MSSGGGGGSDAVAVMRQQEAERQSAINARQQVIDSIFNDPSRQIIYDNINNDVVQAGLHQLDREKSDADRELMFSLARRGLLKSSVDADSRGRLAQNYLENTRRLQDAGNAASNDLRQKDMGEKSRLYAMSVSGGDPASLARQATEAMASNASAVNADNYLANIGGLLGNVSLGINQGLQTPGSGTGQLAKRIGTYFDSSPTSKSGKTTSIGGY